jgi:YfiH family protein
MRPSQPESQTNITDFLKTLSITPDKTVRMHQVHSNTVAWVDSKDAGNVKENTDGLLTQEKNLFLCVVTADCIPLLFFDKKKEYSGVAHAGWKGIYSEIIKMLTRQMKSLGSNPSDIIVGIGPCIRSCCYAISEERAEQFKKKFAPETGFLKQQDEKIFLDLPYLAKRQLDAAGIPEHNIEDTLLCTADDTKKCYSYRKEGSNFGEFMGIIGRKGTTQI